MANVLEADATAEAVAASFTEVVSALELETLPAAVAASAAGAEIVPEADASTEAAAPSFTDVESELAA